LGGRKKNPQTSLHQSKSEVYLERGENTPEESNGGPSLDRDYKSCGGANNKNSPPKATLEKKEAHYQKGKKFCCSRTEGSAGRGGFPKERGFTRKSVKGFRERCETTKKACPEGGL